MILILLIVVFFAGFIGCAMGVKEHTKYEVGFFLLALIWPLVIIGYLTYCAFRLMSENT